MDAPDRRPEVRDPDHDMVDPIGPPELPKLPRFLARSLALTGVAVASPLIVLVIDTSGTPTTRC